jgi:hypothetical protein
MLSDLIRRSFFSSSLIKENIKNILREYSYDEAKSNLDLIKSTYIAAFNLSGTDKINQLDIILNKNDECYSIDVSVMWV